FQLASETLRGSLEECRVNAAEGRENDLTCYLAKRPDGRHALLLVNKHPLTAAEVSLEGPSFKGGATLRRLDASNMQAGPKEVKIDLQGGKISLPPYSITAL